MSLSDEQWAFLQDVAKLIEFAKQKGWKITGGELYRTPEQQEIYVKIGRSKTYNSYHLKRLAIDLNFFKPIFDENGNIIKHKLTWDYNDIKPFGDFWESLNPKNRWGGNFNSFKDIPHFERKV